MKLSGVDTLWPLILVVAIYTSIAKSFTAKRSKYQSESVYEDKTYEYVISPYTPHNEDSQIIHSLKHHYNQSLPLSQNIPFNHTLVIQFDINGDRKSLVLKPFRDVLSESARINWEYDSHIERQFINPRCLYKGHVTETPKSRVVADICNGLYGTIGTDSEDMYISPISETHHGLERHHKLTVRKKKKPHIVPDDYTIGKVYLDDNDIQASIEEEDHHKRQKRSDTYNQGERYIEVLLVTDDSVVDFHGKSLVNQYLLTQMDLVNTVYHSPSLGTEINVVVHELKILSKDVAEKMVVTRDGRGTLDNFCKWAQDLRENNVDPEENTFDMAVLMTRRDIGPAGYAHVTGMCNHDRSCAVNKDDGISSAFVVAHELGHVLGMGHDGDRNSCEASSEDGKIMATTVQANYDKFYWTECSKKDLMKYLPGLNCLNDRPSSTAMKPIFRQPFGQSWSIDEQCRQEFGDRYVLCEAFAGSNPCQYLWCADKDHPLLCKTKRGPPLPGTKCARDRWCMQGECVIRNSVAVHGAWSEWGEWQNCTRSCGIGIRFRYRTCTNPRPKYGGLECHGDAEMYETCNPQPCDQLVDMRAEQCTDYDDEHFVGGIRHTWIPMQRKSTRYTCKLSCISKYSGDVFTTDGNVIDGTFCSYTSDNDICIKGECHSVGCNGVLNSHTRTDKCGVCQGDGSSCLKVEGTFSTTFTHDKGLYYDFISLPAHARNIEINEKHSKHHHEHFLAIREHRDRGEIVLNPMGKKGESREFILYGSLFDYDARDNEGVKTKGPLTGPIDILIHSSSVTQPVTLHYEYTIPKDSNTGDFNMLDKSYMWQHDGWTDCSVSCDGGTQESFYQCVTANTDHHVSEGFCSDITVPDKIKKVCNDQPCFINTYRWTPAEWGDCSASCGKGLKFRELKCKAINLYNTQTDWEVDESHCHTDDRPISRSTCEVPCEGEWQVGEWTECSVTCGSGTEKRSVRCNEPGSNTYTCKGEPPSDTKICDRDRCPQHDVKLELETEKKHHNRHNKYPKIIDDENDSGEEIDNDEEPKYPITHNGYGYDNDDRYGDRKYNPRHHQFDHIFGKTRSTPRGVPNRNRVVTTTEPPRHVVNDRYRQVTLPITTFTTTTTTTAAPPPPKRVVPVCTDRGFFCNKINNAGDCGKFLFQRFCCGTCQKFM